MRDSLKETFDKIYCINLDSRPDKWKMCLEEFEKYNMLDLVERVPAIYHKKGYIGCTYSHLKCMELAKFNKFKKILILEDDFEFVGSTPEKYISKALYQSKTINWDMLYLSYRIELPREFIFYKEISDNLFQSTSQLTTGGYGMTDNVYNFMLNHQKPLLKCLCIDVFYARFLSHKFKCLNIKPMVIGQRNNVYSDIRDRTVQNKWVNKMLNEYV